MAFALIHQSRRDVMRALLVLVLVAAVAFLAFGLWANGSLRPVTRTGTAPTSGTIDTMKARERGAELGEKAAVAAEKAKETVGEAAITTKIKAKMALDDTVKARRIDITTTGTTVTVSGTVASQAEHDRAIALARETNGVARVADRLKIER
jgi:hyperosmotically inducible protein